MFLGKLVLSVGLTTFASLAALAAPTISSVSPSKFTAGSPGQNITVLGSGFTTSAVVQWNGLNRTTTRISSTKLTAHINTADLTTVKTVKVTVRTRYATSNSVAVSIVAPTTTPTSTLAITTPSLPSAQQGTAYSTSLTASGGTSPYSWSIASGALPSGLLLSTSGGIAGTPTTSGTFNITFAAKDAAGTTATKTLSLSVAALPSTPPTTVSGGPVVFYTDITSGPDTGGENGAGAFVTIYGKNFGSARNSSYVTVGGGQVAAYPVWTDRKIVVQLGSAAATGAVVVTTSSASNSDVSFTVRSGNIYCVSTTGNDANPGTFSGGCWATLNRARKTIAAGDIIYAKDGVQQTGNDGSGWCASMTIGVDYGGYGTSSAPKAILAYPGATVTIGNATGVDANGDGGCQSGDLIYGIRSKGTGADYWVFGGLNLRGRISAAETLGNGWRLVGNDITCPNGDSPDACVEGSQVNYVKMLGNTVHDVGKSTASKMYHGVYFTTNSSHIEVGWNSIYNIQGCRGLQFHSTSGSAQFDLQIHDNDIHNTRCDAINLATVDASQPGGVNVYNNVVYNAGTGPDPVDGASDYACIYSPGITYTGTPGSGTIKVYNNTMVNCGVGGNGNRAAVVTENANPNLRVSMTDNIVKQSSGQKYIVNNGSLISGSNNLWYGLGTGPTVSVNDVLADPLFVSTTDFHLQAASPAVHKGITTNSKRDHDGITRDATVGFTLGAYEK